MMTDHQAEVERLLAEYRRSREQLGAVHRELAAITVSRTSQDNSITVTVGPQGTLTGLDISEDAYHRYRAYELAAAIVELVTEAAVQAAAMAQKVLEPVLPRTADPKAVLAGTADLRPEEIVPVQANGATEDDDESLDQRSWLEQAREGRLA